MTHKQALKHCVVSHKCGQTLYFIHQVKVNTQQRRVEGEQTGLGPMLIVSHETSFGLEGMTVLTSICSVLGKVLGLGSKCHPS